MSIRIRDLPADLVHVTGGSFQLLPTGEMSQSSFSPASRSSGARSMVWKANLTIIGFEKEDENLLGRWRVFLAGLQGNMNLFPLSDPTRHLPHGLGAGVSKYAERPETIKFTDPQSRPYEFASDLSLYQGASHCGIMEAQRAGSDTVLLRGLVPDAEVFIQGDYLEINRNLYHVANDAQSDASGASRVQIQPRLWHPVIEGDLVQLCGSTGLFQLLDTQSGAMNHAVNNVSSAEITAVSVPWRI